MEYVIWVIIYIIGWITGIATYRFLKKKPIGTLKVNKTDPDEPYLFLELNDPLWSAKIIGQDEVSLKVEIKE